MFQVKPSWEVRVKIQDQVTNPLLTPKGVLLTSFRCGFFRWISFRFPTHNKQRKKAHTNNQKKSKTSPRFPWEQKKQIGVFLLFHLPICVWGFIAIISSRRCQQLITVSLDRNSNDLRGMD